MTRTFSRVFILLLALGTFACSSSDDDKQNSATGGNSSHGTEEGACAEISEACHAADDGSDDLAAECHLMAHENDVDACESRLDECIDFCHAKMPHGHGGAGGAGH